MEPLIKYPTKDSPSVIFDPTTGVFQIGGVSIMENAINFYTEIYEWLEQYSQAPNPVTDFDFKFEYFNSASSKQIILVLQVLEKVALRNTLNVKWYYKTGEADVLTLSLMCDDIINLDIKFLEF